MTFKTIDQIFELIKNPKNRDIINRGIEIKKRHELHVSGIGLNEFLQKVDGVENQKALENRKKLANTATVGVMANARKPKNKIFSANGAYRHYDIPNDDLRHKFKTDYLSNVIKNTSLTEWMRTEWNLRVDTDPLGMAFAEITKDGSDIYLTYKSCVDYYDIDYSATNRIEYVIFEPFHGENGDKLYRVVDDDIDYLVKVNGESYNIVEDESFPHPFGIVPAVLFSSRNDKKSKSKDTWISESMDSADDYLFDNSIYRIYKTKVGIPYVWEIARECVTCDGVGTVGENADICPDCKGRGQSVNRDVADKIVKPFNADIESSPYDSSDVAGYITAPPEVQTQMVKELDRYSRLIYSDIWGSNQFIEKEGVKTAYEVSINKSPELDKLKLISKNAELVEKFITDLWGVFYIGESYGGSIVNYGDKYSLKTSGELLYLYNINKEKQSSITILNELLIDYYHTEYEENQIKLDRAIKLMLLEPYVHNSIEEVTKLAPSERDYTVKQHFNEYIHRYETEVSKIDFNTVKEINEKLTEYANGDISTYKPFKFSQQPQL